MSQEANEVVLVVKAFAKFWNAHDIDGFAELFAPDAEFVNVVGLWWKGRAQIKAAHEFTHQTMFKNSTLTVVDVDVRFPVPDLALARCLWKLSGHVTPDGAPLPERTGVLLNVVRRDALRWLIVDSQNTDVVEGAVTRPQ
jgi:uncharacterized protein (TIGR02246 family)